MFSQSLIFPRDQLVLLPSIGVPHTMPVLSLPSCRCDPSSAFSWRGAPAFLLVGAAAGALAIHGKYRRTGRHRRLLPSSAHRQFCEGWLHSIGGARVAQGTTLRAAGSNSFQAVAEEWLGPWHSRHLLELEDSLDWSRCFVSVLFVDSPETPSYVRARLAQRLMDAAAEWNGLGKVIEVYACTPVKEGDDVGDDGEDGTLWPEGRPSAQAAAEFANNVGLDGDELEQILRKLGAGWSARLQEEDLREHAAIVVMDRATRDAVATEMKVQGLDPEAGNLVLLSDFVWHFESSWETIQAADCRDGSGTGFLDEKVLRALRRCNFEQASNAALQLCSNKSSVEDSTSMASLLDTPSWPSDVCILPDAAEECSLPGEWRRLHCNLLKGVSGLIWLLVKSWEAKYCNPLQTDKDDTEPSIWSSIKGL